MRSPVMLQTKVIRFVRGSKLIDIGTYRRKCLTCSELSSMRRRRRRTARHSFGRVTSEVLISLWKSFRVAGEANQHSKMGRK
jgi:hypothetical protein